MKSFICASRLSFYESFNSIYSNFARLIHSIPALMLLIGIPFCSTAVAQTAHFSGAVSTVGSGFSCPVGAAVNGSGNIFVVDSCLNAVKEIVAGTGGAASGTVNSSSTVIPVGNGFAIPSGVAVDSSGNVFVADRGHNAVYEIVAGTGGAASGTVNASSTVNPVGNGFSNPDGVAVDGSGNVFVADSGNNVVKVIVAVGGVVSSTSAVYPVGSGFSWPFGVAVDRSGNVFVADIHNNALYEIVAGTPTVNVVGIGYSDPQGVAVDGSGNVFVADTMNNAVKEIVAGTGGAASGTVYWGSTVNVMGSGFSYPAGVAVNGSGNVFVADSGSSVVKEIQTGTANYGSVAVATTAPPTITLTFYFDTGGTIAAPAVLTQGAANKDFTDAGTGTCTTNGTSHAYSAGDTCTVVVTFTPTRPGQRLGAAQLIGSGGGVIATGNIYGIGIGPMVTFPSNTTVRTLGSGFGEPMSVAVDGSGNVFVADYDHSAVKEILAAGGYASVNTVGSGFTYPTGVAVDGSGNVFVADWGNTSSAVKEIVAGTGGATSGTVSSLSIVNTVHSGIDLLSHLYGVAVDGSGDVFFTLQNGNVVEEIVAGTGSAASGTVSSDSTVKTVGSGFNRPSGLAVDGSGNVFVADSFNNAVKEILAVGGYSTVRSVGIGFISPYGVAVDGIGNVFVADYFNNAVKEILSGTGSATSGTVSSDSTVKTVSDVFNQPEGVAVDGSGNVYVADTHNNAVKEIDLSDPPSLSFATTVVGSTSSDSQKTLTVANSGNADLNFPAPGSGNNPSISANFTLDSSGTTACPLVSSGAGSPGTLAQGTSCALPISFVPTSSGGIGGSLVLTDNNLNASGATQTIPLSGTGLIATTTTLNSSLNPSIYGQAVTFTATVTGGDGTPTGTVQFSVDGSAVGSPQTLVGGSATYSTSALAAGTHSITAVYTTDSGSYFATSTSSPLSDTVNASGTSTAVASSSSPYGFSTVDDSVTFTATVTPSTTPSSASAVVISGSVGFYLDGSSTPMSGCSALSYSTSTGNATATCTTSALTASGSPHSIVAGYLGDSNHNSSDNTATPLSQTVNKASTTTTVASSSAGFPPTSSVDDSVTFTATVTPPSGAVVPRGTMQFTDNGSALCTSVSVTWHAGSSNATSACTTSALTASGSSHSIVAVYNGDGYDTNYIKSTSSTLNQVVNKASTTTTVASNSAGSNVNDSVTFTATVAPSPVLSPAIGIFGSVNFQDSGTTITNCGAQPVIFNSGSSTYTATCITSALVAGTHSSIHAVYAGDSNYITSPSSDLQQTVSALAATIGVTSSPSNSTKIDVPVTFTAQLSASSLTPVAPAGKVAFTANSATISGCGAVTVNSSGAAICLASPTTLPVGTNIPISVAYAGDSNYTVAAAGTMSQTVSKADTTTSVTASANPSTVDQSVTFTATVAPSLVPLPANEVPFAGTGTVAFYMDGSSTPMTGCSAQAVTYNAGTGQATAPCASANLTASGSPHSIIAAYGGDANYNGSNNTASPLPQTVNKASTATALTSSPVSPSAVNQSVTFTAQVSPTSGTASVPFSGTVTFKDNGNSIADCPAATISGAGMATCVATSLGATTHNFVATYAGDTNYNISVSNTAAQVVNALTATLSVTAVPVSPTSVNTAVTFTAQLAGVALTPVVPSGTVTFKINGSSNADCPDKTISASGSATCTTSRLAAGSNTITATYSGDSNITVATAGTATYTVSALAATLGVTASPSSSTMVNDSVTFTAQLAGVAFTPVVPSGTVNFTANGSTISGCEAVPVNASGRATCTTSSLAAGSDPIAATYSGDSNYTVSTAGTMTQTVTAMTTTTAAFATLNYSSSSQTVSLSATVTSGSGAVNVGTVTFTVFNGGTLVGAAVTSGTVTSGAASATYTLPGGTAVGAYSIQAVYNASAPFATSSDSTHSFSVGKATATVTLGSLSQTYTGSALAATATTTPSGLTVNFTYNGSSTAPTTVGSYTVVGTISDSNYQGTNTGTLVIGKTSPVVTWATPAAITYGIALSSTQLNATASVPGTFAYTPVAGTGLSPGSQTLSVTFTPTDTTDYSTATASVTLVVNKATPTITWATPASITYGMVLSSTQLNATASVTGTFVYSPAAGTTPAVGSDTLSVTFTPTDTTDYTTATASVTLVVTAYPVPVISSMSPAFTSAGGATFTLTITGTEFVSGSTAYWGTTALATTYVSATQLTAQVTAASIATAGTTAVTIQTPTPGGGTSNSILFEVDTSGSTTTAPTFTSLTATVTAGATASYPVTLPSSVTSVSVTCLNLPTGATCSYSSTTNTVTITTSSTTPKGTYQVTVVFTETVIGAATAGILLPILLLPLLFIRRKLMARGAWVTACLGLVLMTAAALSIGCGGSGFTNQTHVMMSSGSVSLTVQ